MENYFLKLVRATERCFEEGLVFGEDLHLQNICLDDVTQKWGFVDLETFEARPFLQAGREPAKAHENAMNTQSAAYSVHKALVGEFFRTNWQGITSQIIAEELRRK